jgi:acyl-CoA synthetase (NDP forming)
MGVIHHGMASLSELSRKIYPVNRQADQAFGLKAYKDLREVEGPVDLAVSGGFVKETIASCGQKNNRLQEE